LLVCACQHINSVSYIKLSPFRLSILKTNYVQFAWCKQWSLLLLVIQKNDLKSNITEDPDLPIFFRRNPVHLFRANFCILSDFFRVHYSLILKIASNVLKILFLYWMP
jgi:hypothetical protein